MPYSRPAGHEQTCASDGADEQVAQRSCLGLTRHRLPGDDGHRDRQEQREHDRSAAMANSDTLATTAEGRPAP